MLENIGYATGQDQGASAPPQLAGGKSAERAFTRTLAVTDQRQHDWVQTAVNLLFEPLFATVGYPLPRGIAITLSKPVAGDAGGNCVQPYASTDGRHRIFIAADTDDTMLVLARVLHQLIHAAAGPGHEKGSGFAECAKRVGLRGKLRTKRPATTAALREQFERHVEAHGAYPAGRILPATPKQANRQLLAECPECGQKHRMPASGLRKGAPFCGNIEHGGGPGPRCEYDLSLLDPDFLLHDTNEEEGGEKQQPFDFDGLEGKRFPIILADPPWRYGCAGDGNVENHYSTMSLSDIKALPVSDIAADDAVLFLWTTGPKALESAEVARAWGFTVKTLTGFTWVKTYKNAGTLAWGLGNYTVSNAELVLIATKGDIPERRNKDVHSVIISERREHSRKPDEIYRRIESLFHGPYLELFSRTERDGWTAWGSEVGKFNKDEVRKPEIAAPAIITSGPTYAERMVLLPDFRQGDCLEVTKDIPTGSVDAIITSPPFWDRRDYPCYAPGGLWPWFKPRQKEFWRVLKDTGSLIVNLDLLLRGGCIDPESFVLPPEMNKAGWLHVQLPIWHKTNPVPGDHGKRLRHGWELLFHFTKGKDYKFNKDAVRRPAADTTKQLGERRERKGWEATSTGSGFSKSVNCVGREWVDHPDVISAATAKASNHPAAWPPALPEFFTKLVTDPGDTVLDPFVGSGTTCLAACRLGRKSIGIEILPEYYEACLKARDNIGIPV